MVDWNNVPVGRVLGTKNDPRTHHVQALVVALDREARRRIGGPANDLEIPLRLVYGFRRGEVTLDRSIEELGRTGAFAVRAPQDK